MATEPVDLRQGAEGLVAGVRETMGPIALAVRSMSSVPNAGSNRSGWGEATVLGATFFLTIFRDLTEAIVVGFALGSVLFIHRMSRTTAVATHTPFVSRDEADTTRPRGAYDEELAANPDVVV